MDLYPLKFKPILKERLWGGTKLKDVLGKPITSEITGESWELSGVKGDISQVANGPLKGTALDQLIGMDAVALLGKGVIKRFGQEFPILIKFIDAKQDLSIQLHPDDRLAMERHNSFGKTEMWYIMDADPGSELIIGFNREVEKAEYIKSLEEGTLLELMNYQKVEEGDTFFIKTGKIHAIGAGVLLAEIQQTSDVTYRIYDFNRRDKDGNLRELHTSLAVDAIDYEKREDYKIDYARAVDQVNEMVDSPYFKTNYLDLQRPMRLDLSGRDSFTIYMCVGGGVNIANDWGGATIQKGETVLLPASSTFVELEANGAKLLEVTI